MTSCIVKMLLSSLSKFFPFIASDEVNHIIVNKSGLNGFLFTKKCREIFIPFLHNYVFCVGLLEGHRPWNLKYAVAFNENDNEGVEKIPVCPCWAATFEGMRVCKRICQLSFLSESCVHVKRKKTSNRNNVFPVYTNTGIHYGVKKVTNELK